MISSQPSDAAPAAAGAAESDTLPPHDGSGFTSGGGSAAQLEGQEGSLDSWETRDPQGPAGTGELADDYDDSGSESSGDGHPEVDGAGNLLPRKKRRRGRRGGRKIRLRRLAREAADALEAQEKVAEVLGLDKDLVISAGLPLLVAGMAGGNPRAASGLLASQAAAVAAAGQAAAAAAQRLEVPDMASLTLSDTPAQIPSDPDRQLSSLMPRPAAPIMQGGYGRGHGHGQSMGAAELLMAHYSQPSSHSPRSRREPRGAYGHAASGGAPTPGVLPSGFNRRGGRGPPQSQSHSMHRGSMDRPGNAGPGLVPAAGPGPMPMPMILPPGAPGPGGWLVTAPPSVVGPGGPPLVMMAPMPYAIAGPYGWYQAPAPGPIGPAGGGAPAAAGPYPAPMQSQPPPQPSHGHAAQRPGSRNSNASGPGGPAPLPEYRPDGWPVPGQAPPRGGYYSRGGAYTQNRAPFQSGPGQRYTEGFERQQSQGPASFPPPGHNLNASGGAGDLQSPEASVHNGQMARQNKLYVTSSPADQGQGQGGGAGGFRRHASGGPWAQSSAGPSGPASMEYSVYPSPSTQETDGAYRSRPGSSSGYGGGYQGHRSQNWGGGQQSHPH